MLRDYDSIDHEYLHLFFLKIKRFQRENMNHLSPNLTKHIISHDFVIAFSSFFW